MHVSMGHCLINYYVLQDQCIKIIMMSLLTFSLPHCIKQINRFYVALHIKREKGESAIARCNFSFSSV